MQTTVLTLSIDEESQLRFDALRTRYYPPALNRIGAHVTLFHQLPMSDAVRVRLSEVAEGEAAFDAAVSGLQFLGRGVAFAVSSDALIQLHAKLARCFEEHLIPQDRLRFWPHVVVQNKVSPDEAKRTLEELRGCEFPSDVRCVGLDWWEYLGGPWRHVERFHFTV